MRREWSLLLVLALAAGCSKKDTTAPPSKSVAAIAGHVLDGNRAIAGATVTASPNLPDAVTDSSGVVVYQEVPAPAIYTFRVGKPGYVSASAMLSASAGNAYDFTVFMRRTDTLRVVQSAIASDHSRDIAVVDSTAYIAAAAGLDVRDLHAGRFGARLGHLDIPSDNFQHRLAVAGHYAYVATGRSELAVVDIADPAAPVLSVSVSLPDNAHDVAVDGSLLAIADNDSVQFMSLTNPALPVRMSAVKVLLDGLRQGCYGIALDPVRKVAVVCSFNNGVELIRYDDPRAPLYVNQISSNLNPYQADLDVARGVAAIAGDDGVALLDYADPSNPTVLATLAPGGNGGSDALFMGDRVLFATTFNGLEVIDFSDRASPRVTSRLFPGGPIGSPAGLARTGIGAYVAGDTRLSLVEVPAPAPPVPAVRITQHPLPPARERP